MCGTRAAAIFWDPLVEHRRQVVNSTDLTPGRVKVRVRVRVMVRVRARVRVTDVAPVEGIRDGDGLGISQQQGVQVQGVHKKSAMA